MRRLKLQMQMSLDGMVSTGPNDEQKWVTPALDEISADVLALLDSSDTILIGRKLAVDYIPFWQETLQQPEHQMYPIAQRIVAHKKVVFSRSLSESSWPNTEIARGSLSDAVAALKARPGKDLIAYGGSEFIAELIKADLIDAYHFFLNPVAIGQGESVFRSLKGFHRLVLQDSKRYPSGIMLLSYTRP